MRPGIVTFELRKPHFSVNTDHKHFMKARDINDDNKFPLGMFIYAKAQPELKLVIDAYKQRIYFCAVADHPELRQFAYFERELIDPSGPKETQAV